jgi:isoquinoline 1-oxidoreductase beta subunit
MLVAEELECDWALVQPEFIEASDNLARGRQWGDMVTAGSLSIRSSQSYLRKAGAQARLMLVAEAAERWGVKPETCSASQSVVTHLGNGRVFRFGELAEAASRRPIPQDVSLKRPQDWKLIGASVRRFDTIDKAMGRPIYASDVRVPGMLHAAIVACPAYGGLLKRFDASAVLKMPGVKHVIPVADTAVAVVADKWWQAKKAIEILPVTWDEAGAVGLSTDQLKAKYFAALDAKEFAVGQRKGDVDEMLAGAHLVVEADYDVPYLAHTTMEPKPAAHVTDDQSRSMGFPRKTAKVRSTQSPSSWDRPIQGGSTQVPARRRFRASRLGARLGKTSGIDLQSGLRSGQTHLDSRGGCWPRLFPADVHGQTKGRF